MAKARAEVGLRHTLLRLHGMAPTVINGAGMTVATDEESLPELAFDTLAEVLRIVTMLQGWLRQIEPLEQLTPRN
ncbi:hypothetical protein [Cupriavidus sp. AcVe19-6a]|uniref:hypothetical protein n=1 Tax=Cupriavidus sp. AcVe19-6a TaxID=2821358 RepID=UPI001FD86843|nr:hypothetical protein [Cupriavidus sp. AcVe19-6a]